MASRRAWLVAFLLLVAVFSSSRSSEEGEAEAGATLRRQVGSLLKRLNKPPLATFQSPDGDIIDCVHISKQPAFDHPLLKDHTIQHTNPKDQEEDVMRATSVETFGKKTHGSPHLDQLDAVTDDHHYGVAYAMGDAYYGTKVAINVWEPTIVTSGDFSLAQLWIVAGSYSNNDLNTIEAGWQVYPTIYGDGRTRLFIYWTRDAYSTTGCYNLACSGFIQTNNLFVLGGSISPVSSYGVTQYEYDYLVWKDPVGGNWWLQIGGNNIGYWPSSIFTHLRTGVADSVQWGGEVLSPKRTQPMGSGHFPMEGPGKAAYMRTIQVVDSSNNLKAPTGVGLIARLPDCYKVTTGSSSSWGTYIYHGGPGCP
uniref:Neprosin PEP catalytic domain-containing protein n=1 Tax=Leersia perrieri TaxID=77586 RepID=A0A0D9VAV9_9ORYZ